MDADYPFADGRNLVWTLSGYGADDMLCDVVPVPREQVVRVRHLLADGDAWLRDGEYPVTGEAREQLARALGAGLRDGVDYFLGARQDLPGGALWMPPPGTVPEGPVPPP
ncbi:hypothetical protein [Streptomyces luteireticuli]|uniref:hypothetical protein n=1 Tax=Streptomyces luteireticuli TaxID=173858 RepID=UPI00355734CA